MKVKIHPKYHNTSVTCACGQVIETGSTKKDLKVENKKEEKEQMGLEF